MKSNKTFLLSGVISISFYLLICIFFIYLINSNSVKTFTSKNKQTVIQLSMITTKSDKKRVEKKTDIKEKPKTKEVVKKETSISKKKSPDLKSLFGNVKTNVTKKAQKEVNNVSKSSDPKRYKSKFEKQNKSSNVKVDSLLEDKITTTNITSKTFSKNNESDEYFSLVNDKLASWNPYIAFNYLEATVLVTIENNGKFDYEFINYSQNLKFDESLKAFLEEQKSIMYPKPKNANTVKIRVKFKSKG